MLTSPDTRSILSALVMMLNSIHASPERAYVIKSAYFLTLICQQEAHDYQTNRFEDMHRSS